MGCGEESVYLGLGIYISPGGHFLPWAESFSLFTNYQLPSWVSPVVAAITMPSLRELSTLLLSSTAASAAAIFQRTNTTAPTVTLKNGSYFGVHSSIYNQDYFLGVPFAQPPLGDLRLRQPQSINTTWTDARNATVYRPECFGYGSDQWVLGNFVDEDCLHTNVIRPAGVSPDTKLPVAVWFHGGGFNQGGNADPRYNMSFIVQQGVEVGKPFIAVVPNYRLSLFGFIYGQEVIDAGITNLGLLDQRLALHWVQENIADFGGDPAKVTIW